MELTDNSLHFCAFKKSLQLTACHVHVSFVMLKNLKLGVDKVQLCAKQLLTFNGPLSGTTRVSQYQKGETNLDFTEARGSEWQWHQLGHMQVCTSLQTDNHTSNPPLSFFYSLPAAQPTVSKH